MKAQKELPDSVALVLIVFLVIGTVSYFVYNHWQRVQNIENMAEQVTAGQVADKMAKQRQDFRAVMNGEKTLADVDAEAASAATNASSIQKVAGTVEPPKTTEQKQQPAVEKEQEKPAKKPEAAEKAKAESKPAGTSSALPVEQKTAASASLVGDLNQYSCSQKQQCSQMRSCAEAKFYAKQCSNSKIKPDENGKVCPELCGV